MMQKQMIFGVFEASNLQGNFCDILKINRLRISVISHIPSRCLRKLLILAVPLLIEKIPATASG
jgi:hypothetical protein